MSFKKYFVLSSSCFLLAFLLLIFHSQMDGEALASKIAPEILRFHVLANSNTKKDQELKLQVRSMILEQIYDGMDSDSLAENSKEATKRYIAAHRVELEEAAETYMKDLGCSYSAHIEIADSYFPSKTYGKLTFPRGTYEAVRITLGEGRGRNWWCVLYPPLCFTDAAYAIVPDESQEQLRSSLLPDDYAALLHPRPELIRIRPRIKLLELLKR